jgi:hypothetical protein
MPPNSGGFFYMGNRLKSSLVLLLINLFVILISKNFKQLFIRIFILINI